MSNNIAKVITMNDTAATLRSKILDVFSNVYSQQQGDETSMKIADDAVLLETGIDSLGFAIIVTQLEEDLGYDPFSLSTDAYYPQTFGEFVTFYGKFAPA